MDRSKWEYKPFEDCIEKFKKTKQLMTSDYQPDGEYPIISQEASLISGYTDDSDYVNHFNRPVVIFGDHTRVLKYVDFDFAVGADGVKILIPHTNLDAKFLLSFLTWYKIPNLGYSRHYKLLKEISVPVPPIADQQRIVAELDCLNEMIAVKQEQLKEFDKLAQSIFYDMFGDPSHNEKQWELKSLKDISNEKLSYGSGASAISYDGQTRYIRITDINDKGELNDDIVSPSVYDEKYLLNDGDILFARSGATVGKTYCHNSKNGQCIYAGYLIRLVPNKELVLPSYVFSYTKTPYYRSFVEAAQRAVAQPNINAKQYGDLLICIPPLSLQQQFAEKISAIEAQKELVKQSIAETQSLFNSRIDFYFN